MVHLYQHQVGWKSKINSVMATVSPIAISAFPVVLELQNDPSRLSFVNLLLPSCKRKVSNRRCSYFQGQRIGTPERLPEWNDAQQPSEVLPSRDQVTCSNIIASNSESGNLFQAFVLFEEMLGEGLRPNGFAVVSLLKASPGFGGTGLSRQLHGWSIQAGFRLDARVRVALITMYSRCGMLDDARQVFDETLLSSLDCVSLWNSIIAAYILHGFWFEAFRLFGEMLAIGLVAPTELTYASIVNACSLAGEEKYGVMTHGRIIKDGLLGATNLCNSLVTYYAKSGNLENANQLFEGISRKDVVSWNAIIAANEQSREDEKAIELFRRMLRIEPPVQPNRITFLSMLSAVSSLAALNLGREIHACVIRLGLDLDTSIVNALVTMYSKCREVSKARVVFETLSFKDVVTWNSMLAAYEQNEQQASCFHIFKKMQVSGIEPDLHSYTIILNAASSDSSGLTNLRRGQEIHGYILRRTTRGGLSLSTSNAVLKMYSKFGRMQDAEKIFQGIRQRDSYSWNTMMDGYYSNAKFKEASLIFIDMLKQGLQLDPLCFSIMLASCGRLAFLQLGQQFHSVSLKLFSDRDSTCQNSLLSLNNSMISMYSKCGSMDNASQVFFKMKNRDVFSWSAMITGYAHYGMASKSLELFEMMITDGIMPNHVTFLGLLTACAHGGLIKKGTCYFNSMIRDYNLNPSIKHYACMIDLFGRSGQFDFAKSIVNSAIIHFRPNHGDASNLWRVLLGACHAHKHLELGVEAAMKILELEPEDESTYILLSNLYASLGLWKDAIKVRKTMTDKGLKKEAGCSWVDSGNRRHIFVAGDVSHPQRKEIYEKLAELNFRLRGMGYVPMTEFVLHDVDEMQKEAIIGCHSEKLAVAFGILHSGVRSRGVIRVMKNLRVCGDCHNWMKFTSLAEGKDILLRDSRRFHFFRDGKCSCKDFW